MECSEVKVTQSKTTPVKSRYLKDVLMYRNKVKILCFLITTGLETCLASPSPLPSASLARQWSSWRCVWGRYHVGILPCGPVSERRSCSASVCHRTCWHSWFPQWTVALSAGSTNAAPDHNTPTTMLDCRQDTLVFVLLTWLPPHTLDTIWTKYVYLGLIRPHHRTWFQ